MNAKLLICFLILIGTVKAIANSSDTQIMENTQDIIVQNEKIKMPWSDCTEINKISEKKFSFSKQQVKKESKIHEKYKQFYLNHNNFNSFSMQFREKKTETEGLETIISGFLKFCEDNFQTNKSRSLNYNIKKQQEQWFNDMRNENYKIYYKQKYNNTLLPLHN